jgi:alkaline phosphatase
MRKLSKTFAIALASVLAACAPTTARNVIFMQADGAGIAYWSAAAHARDEPSFTMMPVVALIEPRSAGHRVPDSAATASAYATGELVMNRVISMVGCPQPEPRDPVGPIPEGCEPVDSWFDIARERGKALGIVTTTDVVDASPAAFVATSPSRYWGQSIAEQFVAAELDVLLGGGRRHFDPSVREDGADLLSALCSRAVCVSSPGEVAEYTPADGPVVGLFTDGDMGPVAERPLPLTAMTEMALARLSLDPDGFVVLIETEGTDNSGHANESLESITAEMLEFDDAVEMAMEFAQRHRGTLVIVTADHETGGLALGQTESPDSLVAAYTTRGHTASMIPLFAVGPGSERFAGVHTNAEIGLLLKEILSGR